jgi:predicted  nucleic acid-binding Zn-ribbon protein
MNGLLSRAKEIRRKLGLSAPVNRPIENDEDLEGVSRDELESINRKIEEVAAANRIDVGGDTFKIAAAKSGLALPLLVNLGSLVVLAAGIGLMFLLFQQSETTIEQDIQSLSSTEGVLLEVLRQEAAANLAAKEAEIAAIQDQLSRIQSERDDLAANFESQLASREAQLRATLDAELEEERERLRAQGLSAEEIEVEIERLRIEKETALAQALAEYQRELQAERDRAEAALSQVEAEAAANLIAANEIRAELEAEARQRVAELQAQLEAARQENQAELDEASQQVEAARQALASLNAQREQEQALSVQLNGFYSQIRTQINNENYPQAQNTLELLRSFLNSEQFLAVESLRQRRETEVFIANALSQLITSSQRRSADTASLAQTASLVTEIRAIYGQARDLSTGGQREQALELYREAIDLIPEISQAYEELRTEQVRSIQTSTDEQVSEAEAEVEARLSEEYQLQLEELETRLNAELAAQRDQLAAREQTIAQRDSTIAGLRTEISGLNARLDELELALEDRNAEYAALESGLAELEDIRANLGDQADDLITQLGDYQNQLDSRDQRIGELEAELQTLRDSLGASGDDLSSALTRLSEIRRSLSVQSDEQIADALDELQAEADRVPSLESDLTAARSRLSAIETGLSGTGVSPEQAGSSIADLRRQVEEAEARAASAAAAGQTTADGGGSATDSEALAELRSEIDRLTAALESSEDTAGERQETILSLEADLSQLQSRADDLADRNRTLDEALNTATSSNARLTRETSEEIAGLKNDIEDLQGELQEAVDRYDSLIDAYQSYRREESRAISAGGGDALAVLRGKVALDRFLSDEAVQSAFPGLIDQIKAYDEAFQQSGQETVVYTMADEIYNVYSYPTPSARLDYIDEQVAATDDPAMIEFYANLRLIILER